jgi:uncharacterized protein (UPF0548 family)
MFLLSEPSHERVRKFLLAEQDRPFSYSEVGATRDGPPARYTLDHSRVRLGRGEDKYTRAAQAIRKWEMFHLGWVKLFWTDTPIEAGATVAVLARHLGFYSLNACRIVYLIEEDGPAKKFGFAYGTLANHAERGEERFSVEWRRDDDSVWYDILAVSRPNQFLARAGYPIARALQKRFARDSKLAMLKFVNASGEQDEL